MSKSDAKVYAGLIATVLVVAAFVWFVVYMVMDVEHQKDIEQKKQDKCIAAGGMWIDNRRTESYCYMPK